MSGEQLPDEALRGSFQQAVATGLQIGAAWEQRRHRLMMAEQMRLQQGEATARAGGAEQRAGDLAGLARDRERLEQTWPLVAQVDQEWARHAGHTDLARAWFHAAMHEAMYETMAGPPDRVAARRREATRAADLIEDELRRRAPASMQHYDAARQPTGNGRRRSRMDAMGPIVRRLDAELAAAARRTPPTGRGPGPASAAAASTTSTTTTSATATATAAAASDRVRQACRQAATAWGAGARFQRRPASTAAGAGAPAAQHEQTRTPPSAPPRRSR